jgi:hypothetical protein
MTSQEIFDKVKAHLLKQNKQSLDDDGSCRYRNSDGTRCAVGIFIDDNWYSESLEGKDCQSTLVTDVLKKLKFSSKQICLLSSLQDIHDCVEPKKWPYRLELCAKQYRLNP